MIETARLRLVPATLTLARAEMGDLAELARVLGAKGVVPHRREQRPLGPATVRREGKDLT